MSADFSKLLAALAKANEEHADRDGLSPVRRAVFLARGGHAPGEACPSAKDEPAGERAWCFTCERWHEPMEWGDGCQDDPCNCVHRCPHGDRCLGGHADYPDGHWYHCDTCTPKRTITMEQARAERAHRGHHRQRRQTAAGTWEVARPLRDTSWWHRWKQERACRKTIGHCWHPDGFVDWWCCLCSGETDGMPAQNCIYCKETDDGRS